LRQSQSGGTCCTSIRAITEIPPIISEDPQRSAKQAESAAWQAESAAWQARTDRRIDAISKILKTGMKMMANTEAQRNQLAEAQK
jgi:hypothetical protein